MIDSIIYTSEMQNTHKSLEELTSYFNMQLSQGYSSVLDTITLEYKYVFAPGGTDEPYEVISLPEIISTPKALYTFGTHSVFWDLSKPNKNATG